MRMAQDKFAVVVADRADVLLELLQDSDSRSRKES